MVTDNRVAFTAPGRGPLDDILHRSVMLIHIEVGRRKVVYMVAEILGNGQSFKVIA